MENRKVKALLFPRFEKYTLPAKGNYAEKQMVVLNYFDLDLGELIEYKISEDDYTLAAVEENLFVSKNHYPVVIIEFELVSKGSYYLMTLKGVSLDKKSQVVVKSS